MNNKWMQEQLNEITATHVALSAAWLAGLAVAGMLLPLGIVIGMLGVLCAAAGALGYRMLRQPRALPEVQPEPRQVPEWTVAEDVPQLPEARPRALLGGGR